jgi:hypothetical protein
VSTGAGEQLAQRLRSVLEYGHRLSENVFFDDLERASGPDQLGFYALIKIRHVLFLAVTAV